MEQRHISHRRKNPIWLYILIGLLAFLLVVTLTVVIFVNVTLNKIGRIVPSVQEYMTQDEAREYDLRQAVEEGQQRNPAVVYPELDESTIHWSTPTETIGSDQALVNILLIGQDRREGESRQRSDSMILLSFNKPRGTITMTSFLRDLYVQIPGYQSNRLNAAYAFGGMELLDKTLETNFGIHIDANIEVDFDGFSSIIDTLGGVDIELTQSEADYMGLSAGRQHMDGETALDYSRIRYLDSDFGRTQRQRNVLSSVYHSTKNLSLPKALDLVNNVFPLLTTDMTNAEILSYATNLFPMLSSGTLQTARIPADDTYSYNTVRGMSVIIADFDANRQHLKDTLTPAA